MSDLLRDARRALVGLARSPGFAAAAVEPVVSLRSE